MNPLDPRLEHILSRARSAPTAPSRRLETLVLSAWRDRSAEPDLGSIYRAALAGACGLLILTAIASSFVLTEAENPAVFLANTALHQAFHP